MTKAEEAAKANVMWYRKPAEQWNEALPIGNGTLGAMVFGRTDKERLALNEDTVWYGGPRDRNNPDALPNLPRIRELLLGGRLREAEELAAMALPGMPECQRHYMPLGDLELEFPTAGETKHYRRELDLDRAIAGVTYVQAGVRHERELAASYPNGVISVRLTADRPGSVTFKARWNRNHFKYMDTVGQWEQSGLVMNGSSGEGGVRFSAVVKVAAIGGAIRTIGDRLLVEGADEATLYVAAGTTFRFENPEGACKERINEACKLDYAKLLERHVADYRALFGRVEFSLGQAEPFGELATDERLQRVEREEDDPGLVALYLQYGRYLLIASSRPGSMPANLQGIWNEHFLPPWDSKYTININTQMNYWMAETGNLAECHLPLFELIERMREPGKKTAQSMYSCRGFTAHHNTDIWADTAPQDTYMPASFWPMGAAWLCLHLWEHYRFGGDIDFLRQAYPTMKDAALFLTDYLIEGEDGKLVTCPSVSPENTYILPGGESGVLCVGASMDFQIIYALLEACLAGAVLLGADEELRGQWQAVLERLPEPKIGKYGQIQEWMEDYEEAEPGHRHISHLFGLYPGEQFTIDRTPELARAAKVTLERRLASGGGHTGWSRAWIINFWARLREAGLARANVMALLGHSTLPNLLDNHPPFQIDGNFGGAAGIVEMLLQSHEDAIHVLPAWPDEWSDGQVKGLRARGGYTLDFWWAGGELRELRVKAARDGVCRILVAGTAWPELAAHAGVTYAIQAGESVWAIKD